MIDLNHAEEQYEGGPGAVPPDSVVLLQLCLRHPTADKAGSLEGLTRARSGMEYLSCEFVIAAGAYAGGKFWNNMMVGGASTPGQEKAVSISMRTIRAMIEASRNIAPTDQSPAAVQGRVLSSWMDLDGIYFPAKLGCEVSDPRERDGRRFVNNTLKLVVTPDKPEYQVVSGGGEIITDNPLPVIEDGPAHAPAHAPTHAPTWAAAPPAAPPAASAAPAPRTGTPAWAAAPPTRMAPPPQAPF